jgi:hypothetical protein
MAMNRIKNIQQRAGNRGFALLIAVVFMSVMLSIGLSLGSIGYKQAVLAQNALESQYAFYAADGGLECVLFQAQQRDRFSYTLTSAPSFTCNNQGTYNGVAGTLGTSYIGNNQYKSFQYRFELLTNPTDVRCVDISVYVPPNPTLTTYLFSQGYSTKCSTVEANGRFSTRGIQAYY